MKSISKHIEAIVLAPFTHAGVKYAPGDQTVLLPKHDFDYLVAGGNVRSMVSRPEPEALAPEIQTPASAGPSLVETQDQSLERDPGGETASKIGTSTPRRRGRKKGQPHEHK